MPTLNKLRSSSLKNSFCFLGNQIPSSIVDSITDKTANSLKREFEVGQKSRAIFENGMLIIQGAKDVDGRSFKEEARQFGALVWEELYRQRIDSINVIGENSVSIAFGIALRDYRFETYKREKNPFQLENIEIEADTDKVKELNGLIKSICFARDLVNEPANILTATKLAERIERAGKEGNYSVEVFKKAKIETLKMGGILSVNQGSTKEPTFTIIEHKPANPSNSEPIVLVGKGIVYDTGGLSLKPTANSMDIMKCDMGGAAAVAGAIHACALNELPIHVIGLIPATDNQPGPDAYAPGDVITIYDGTQVEVMNTDAEGRIVMADALAYAKQFNPKLVMDFATLTGSSMRAIGNYAAATMGTADEKTKKEFAAAGFASHERLVEFPLWDDYDQDLQSDIADTKNLGSTPMADVIIAGKFLQKFTDYPWIHVDIAGPAFLPSKRGYLPKGATGFGVHLLYEFFKKMSA
ncbi:MAG: peptidase M17 [Flavobacteriales bacterium]|nr:peptidase M17 [Flavobacteriales bacterium]